MTLVQLQYVITVEEEKSINAAAKKLYVAQSSISGAIKDLEEELGIQIYNRSNRGITLTKDGEEFLKYAKNVVLQFKLLIDRYNRENVVYKEKFSVTLHHSNFAAREFAEIIKEFGTENFEYSILETSTQKVINDVKDYHSELGIIQINNYNKEMYMRFFNKEGIEFHTLGSCNVCVYLSKDHPLADRDMVDVTDLEDYPCLTYYVNHIHEMEDKYICDYLRKTCNYCLFLARYTCRIMANNYVIYVNDVK